MRSACLVQAHRIPSIWVGSFASSARKSSSEATPLSATLRPPEPSSRSKPDSPPPIHSSPRRGPTYRSLNGETASFAEYDEPKPSSITPFDSDSILESVLKDTSLKHQIYISHRSSPYENLSLEHYILQNSHPDSRILFLYQNAPCVVIGRNQNPWLETNLDALYHPSHTEGKYGKFETSMVRRRSGGGSVYHDFGNLNYSIICPPAEFGRDKHALMVASALGSLGVKGARVNERHDIVVDRSIGFDRTVKVSGSAYKLTRQRALHHGTLLLYARLSAARQYLRSPASEFIKARGVESVRSPIGNISFDLSQNTNFLNERAKAEIIRQFASIYNLDLPSTDWHQKKDHREDLRVGDGWVLGHFFAGGWLPTADPEYQQGIKELKSTEWRYDQTPQFTFSTFPTEEDPRERSPLPRDLPRSTRIEIKVKNGVIIGSKISFLMDADKAAAQAEQINEALLDKKLTKLGDWTPYLGDMGYSAETRAVGKWLNETLPSPKYLSIRAIRQSRSTLANP